MTVDALRNIFPQLGEKVYGKTLVYLDNAATSMRPRCVVDKWVEMSTKYNANLHRAVHYLADRATEEYEGTREVVRNFINAEDKDEIVFTSGTTMSINLVAATFGEKFVGEEDHVFVLESEHHSNIVPWQILCEKKKAVLRVVPVDENGYPDLQYLRENVTEQAKILCCAQISNVLGLVNPVKDIVNICHSVGCKVLLDGAQGVVHCCTDVKDIDCDFYAFSGHKLYAAPGVGVLYAKKSILEQMPPYMSGGEMIDTVKFSGTTYASAPHRFEAGTQNFSGVPTLKPAIELAMQMRCAEIESSQTKITEYLLHELPKVDGLRLYGNPVIASDKIPLFSFSVKGAHHEDLALILDKMGIAVRSGQMCAEPLMDRYGVTGMLRASFAPYNTIGEAEYFVESLGKAILMLR